MRSVKSVLIMAAAASVCATAASAASIQTTRECHVSGSWFDVCSYTNICFSDSPNAMVFITDDPSSFSRKKRGSNYIWATTKLFRKHPPPPDPKRESPTHYKRTGVTRAVKPEWIEENSSDVLWFDKTMYIPSYFEALGNVWYFSSRVLPLYTARFYADEWNLPPMEEVLLLGPERKVKHNWHQNVLHRAISNETKLFYASDEPYQAIRRNDHKLTCFKKAVLLGATMYGFTDMMVAFQFRREVWESLGIEYVPEDKPPKTITILDRGRYKPRHFDNIPEMEEIIQRYGYTVQRVIIEDDTTFEEQVRLMANTGLLITMHGAGLMNEIFMPPGSAVIEIFPVHLKHVLYERIAHYAGVYHFKVYAREFGKGFHKKHPEYRDLGCDNATSLSISDHGSCWLQIKNSNVVTPLPEFEVALVNAMDHIGSRTYLNGQPTAQSSKETFTDQSRNWDW